MSPEDYAILLAQYIRCLDHRDSYPVGSDEWQQGEEAATRLSELYPELSGYEDN